MKNSQKGFVVPLLIVVAVLAIGGGIYFYSKTKTAPSDTDIQTNTQNTTADQTADWRTYTSAEYGISFKYPSSWKRGEVTQGLMLDGSEVEFDNSFIVSLHSKSNKPLIDQPGSVIVGGIESKMISTSQTGTVIDIPFRDNMFLEIGSGADYNDPVLQGILSTFKFTK